MSLSQADPAYFEQAAAIIRADPALSGQVIRIANSALYTGQARVEDLDEAVLRVGIRMVVATLSTKHLRRSFDPKRPGLNTIWIDAAFSAAVCRRLATEAGWAGLPPELAYTHGLLHDVGRRVLFDLYESSQESEPRERLCPVTELAAWENERFGASHALAGRLLANLWGLPPDVATVIGAHHFSDEHRAPLSDHVNRLIDLVLLADLVVHHLDDPGAALGRDPGDALLARLGFQAGQILDALPHARQDMMHQVGALGLSPSPDEAPIVLA